MLLVLVTSTIAKKSFNEYFLKEGYYTVYVHGIIFVYYTLYTTIQSLFFHISTPKQSNYFCVAKKQRVAAFFIRVKPCFLLSLGKQLLMAPLKMGIFMQCSQCSLMAEYLRSTEVLTHPPALRPQTHTANRDHPLPSITCWARTTRPALGSLGLAEHLEKSPVCWEMGKQTLQHLLWVALCAGLGLSASLRRCREHGHEGPGPPGHG